MPPVNVRSCSAFVWILSSKNLLKVKGCSHKEGSWPMMTVTVTNFEGFTGQQF